MGSKRKQKKTTNSIVSGSWLNKYSLSLIFFMVWMCFFAKHNLFTQYKLSETIDKLEVKKLSLKQDLKDVKAERAALQNNIEKFARENYFMHKDNEEVFIIEK